MTIPADHELKSPLEEALLDVHAALAELLVVADEQHAAIVAHDRDRLESVTRQQERLSDRLARAESRRVALLSGAPLQTVVAALPPQQAARTHSLNESIATAVTVLKERQAHTASLLQQSIDLAAQTLNFLQRLVTVQAPMYGARGINTTRQSVLLDGRA
ncbi:MAG TPA: flagellar export chaperone FlgN [Chloroflexota bacterium]|jgi:flagellar biosynthesis/type III secretory pathway chaperone|nr:flagellar export chaperone FlgN [Chloroflexota bacterium]